MPDISEGERVSPPWAKIMCPLAVAPALALGLDHSRKPGESAAALPVGHQLVRHQIDVIDQNERNACGRVRRRTGKANAADRNKQKAGGKAAGNQEHESQVGGMWLASRLRSSQIIAAHSDARLGYRWRLSGAMGAPLICRAAQMERSPGTGQIGHLRSILPSHGELHFTQP